MIIRFVFLSWIGVFVYVNKINVLCFLLLFFFKVCLFWEDVKERKKEGIKEYDGSYMKGI